MIDMDRQRAFAVLGLPDDASSDEIDALVRERRRKLRQRIIFASSAEQRRSSERALAELESAHIVASIALEDSQSFPPSGSKLNFAAGVTLGDRYVIRDRVGYGESGAVFAALDLSSGKDVALKFIRSELLLVPGTRKRLNAAIETISGLIHEGIARVYGVSDLIGHAVVQTELLPQRNLRSLVESHKTQPLGARRGGLQIKQIAEIIKQVSAALDDARQKTLHLNLKPENIILTDGGGIKLTDFGFESILGPALQITNPTAREQRRYRAPEVARQSESGTSGDAPVGEQADQYSLAAIAHYLLLSTAPYPDPSAYSLQHMGLSEPMAKVLSRALSASPASRFPSVSDFSTAFVRASKSRISQRVVLNSALSMTLATLILFGGISLVTGEDNPLSTLAKPLMSMIPGLGTLPAQQTEVLLTQDKVLALSRELTSAQNALRRAVFEARIDLRAKAQVIDLAETGDQLQQAEAAYSQADAHLQRLTALWDVANPEIFNSPDALNAVNLIGLANEHITQGRPENAGTVLRRAEIVLREKLRDYAQAETLITQQFSNVEGAEPQTENLRRAWQSASQDRRRVATEIQSKMVTIPRGSFDMGDVAGIGNATEQPIRSVLVPAFQLSAYEVTVQEYGLCILDGVCANIIDDSPGLSENTPLTGASWFDAQAYLTWISQKTGEDYRLPTEAEWEYAAQANLGLAYPWGVQAGRGMANCINCGSAWEGVGVAPVASFAPNAFGLYDMAGNVWEWTADCWYPNYEAAPAIAIAREDNALCSERVMRGGSWDNESWLARTTYRGRGRADMRQDLTGFRIAKSLN
ncbi:MAG: bifunctional serine/threonine-protein kinase/formylglycine-generating enzyme family protein [Rhodospirillaceae bacterium]